MDWSRAQVDRPSCNGCGRAVEWADLRWRVAVGVDAAAGGYGSVAVGAVPDGEPWHRACRRRHEWFALVAAVRDVGGSAVVVVESLAPVVGQVVPAVAALAAANRRAVEQRAAVLVGTVREDVARWWRRAPVERVVRPVVEWGALAVVAAGERWRQRRRPGGWDDGSGTARLRSGRVGDAGRDVLDGHVEVGSVVAPDDYRRWGFRFGSGEFRPVFLRWPDDGREYEPPADEAAAVDGAGLDPAGHYTGWLDEGWIRRAVRGDDPADFRRASLDGPDVDTTGERGRDQRPGDNGR